MRRIDLSWYLRQRPNLPRCRLVALAHILHSRGRYRTSYSDGMPNGVPSLEEQQTSYSRKARALAKRMSAGERIRALFIVSSAAVFPMRALFDLMRQDARFETRVLVTPYPEKPDDMSAYEVFCAEFGEGMVLPPMDESGKWRDPSELADIVFYSSPYEAVTPLHSISRALTADFLPVLANYGYPRSEYDNRLFEMDAYAIAWKMFLENEAVAKEYRKHSAIGGTNGVVVGSIAMDGYRNESNASIPSHRKTVLIAPHHTVKGGFNKILSLSNFLEYSENLIDLPRRYPQVDFIFRPHPALFSVLKIRRIWSDEKIADYRRRMEANLNVRWSEGCSVWNDFAASDAMIDDCGSFMVDYFYTGKPQCYMLKSPKDLSKKFTSFGRECLAHCTVAYSFDNVLKFMDEVVVGGNDSKAESRRQFAATCVMINHPNVAKTALEEVCKF